MAWITGSRTEFAFDPLGLALLDPPYALAELSRVPLRSRNDLGAQLSRRPHGDVIRHVLQDLPGRRFAEDRQVLSRGDGEFISPVSSVLQGARTFEVWTECRAGVFVGMC